jgi:MFS family permease
VLDTYRAAFHAPGTAAFTAAGFVMRMPIAIYPIGLVLLLSIGTGHYSFAGLLSGTYVVANGIGTPVLGRLVDRYGQHRLLIPASAGHIAAAIALGLLVGANAPDAVLLAPATVLGFCYLSVGSLTRARWSFVLAGRPELNTGYSVESILDELIFTVGPLIATLIATQIDPLGVLVVGAALVGVGAVWLRQQRSTEPPAHPAGAPRRPSALRYAGMPLLVAAGAAMGGVFASAEVTAIAFCGQRDATAWSGLVLAAFATGSALSGFFYGSRHWHAPVLERFRIQAMVFGVLPWLFLLAANVPLLTVIIFVVGLGIAPTLITAFTLIQQLVPAAALTESMGWFSTGIAMGYGIVSAFVGRIADSHGARPAFLVTVGCGLALGVSAVMLHRRLARRPVAPQPVSVGPE